MEKIAIFGAGNCGRLIAQKLIDEGKEVVAFIDNDAQKEGEIVYLKNENSSLGSTNSACSDFLGSASASSLQRTASASRSSALHNPKNSSTILEFATQNPPLTQDTRIFSNANGGELQGDSAKDSGDSMESNAESSENNTVFARLDEVKSWQSINEINPHEVRTLKGVVGGGERLRGGLDFAIRKNPCIQAPSPLAEKATSDSKITAESRWSERAESFTKNAESHIESAKDSNTSVESAKDSNIMDCHEAKASRNDDYAVDSHENPYGFSRNDAPLSSLRGDNSPKQSIYDSIENDFKDSIDCLVPNGLRNEDSIKSSDFIDSHEFNKLNSRNDDNTADSSDSANLAILHSTSLNGGGVSQSILPKSFWI